MRISPLISLAASAMLLLLTIGLTLYAYRRLGIAERVGVVAYMISFSILTTIYVIKVFFVDISIPFLLVATLGLAPLLLYKFVERRQTRKR